MSNIWYGFNAEVIANKTGKLPRFMQNGEKIKIIEKLQVYHHRTFWYWVETHDSLLNYKIAVGKRSYNTGVAPLLYRWSEKTGNVNYGHAVSSTDSSRTLAQASIKIKPIFNFTAAEELVVNHYKNYTPNKFTIRWFERFIEG